MKMLPASRKRPFILPQSHLARLEEEATASQGTKTVSSIVRGLVAEHVGKQDKKDTCLCCLKRKRFKDSWLCSQCLKQAAS